ncbi:unnamed protein product [Allacma fusca]|uniref:C2H2-type domain-containing protein n=1 Tax=Allacma fusca TaxID=39272 RepID=A0A8J2K4F4_9HEXA|nr:unnamed protein product [Allacma fusca]
MELKLVPGQRGKNHLLYEGHRYCMKKVLENTTTWEYCHRKSRHCQGKCTTTNNDVHVYVDHNHSPSIGSNESFAKVAEIKRKAVSTNDRPVNIIAETTDGVDEGVISQLPSSQCLSRMVRNTRKATGRHDILPTSLVDLVIPDGLKTTLSGDQFLLHDSGAGPHRILVFSTARDMGVLAENRDWYMDGTFKTCPFPFHQICTTHGFRMNTSLSTVFALLPNKMESSYSRLAAVLQKLQPGLAPSSIITDFEYAAINAFREAFPESEMRGCFFHFQQCLWRQIQGKRSICDRKRTSADFSLMMRHFLSLAFVLKNHMLNEGIDGIHNFVQYFEETWVGTPPRRGQWRPSRFDVAVWNTHGAVLRDQHRTNNNLEGWHTRFETMIGLHHPTLWKCIEGFIKEQNMSRVRTIQFLAGENPLLSRKTYRLLDNRQTIVNHDKCMVCRQDLNESAIQLEFVNDQDSEVAEEREVETDEEVVVVGGHVGGLPLVNRGQVARHGRRRPGHCGMAVTIVAEAVSRAEDKAGNGADVAEAVGGAEDGAGEEDRAGDGADVAEDMAGYGAVVAEAVGRAEDKAGNGADVAEAVGGAEDGAGEGAEAAVFVGAGFDVVEVEGADVGANAVLGAEVAAEVVRRDVHPCPQCGRSFHTRSARTQHMQMHEERRQFPGCPVSFANNNSLNRHRRRYGH